MDPLTIAGIASGVAGLAGGAMASAANAKEAARNRRFQEYMRATQYQTATRDMRAAGLNPALAYMQGGAGNLSGSTMDVSQFGEAVGSAIPKGLATATAKEAFRQQKAEATKSESEGARASYEAEMAALETARMRHWYGFTDHSGKHISPSSPLAAEMRRAMAVTQAAELSNEELRAMAQMWSRMGSSGKFMEFALPFLRTLIQRR